MKLWHEKFLKLLGKEAAQLLSCCQEVSGIALDSAGLDICSLDSMGSSELTLERGRIWVK
jgi:hypothetical protein